MAIEADLKQKSMLVRERGVVRAGSLLHLFLPAPRWPPRPLSKSAAPLVAPTSLVAAGALHEAAK